MLNQLVIKEGSRKKKKRIGRGESSGHGKTSGRGNKGQKARAGGYVSPGFEGGQMPLQRRLPKRGFTNIFKKEYSIVNLRDLTSFDDNTRVNIDLLKERGIVRKREKTFKVLGKGTLSKPLTVVANMFSASARKKIEEAGGSVEVMN